MGPGGTSNRHAALIDSGSDYTLAATAVALEAAIDLESGRLTTVRVGGAVRDISVLETALRLCDPALKDADGGCEEDNALTWQADVGFFTAWHDPPFTVILGQVGFFDMFAVTMSRFSQVAVIQERDHAEAFAAQTFT
jgi:hypothetical protein